jgi:hypothetical protein
MASSTDKNEQQQHEQMFNSSDQLPYQVKFNNDNRNSPKLKTRSLTQDDSSIASQQGLFFILK